MFYFLADFFFFFFFSNFLFLNFASPDSAIFKNSLFFLCMERNLQTEIKFNPNLNFRNLGEKRRFGYFQFYSTHICQAVLTSSV